MGTELVCLAVAQILLQRRLQALPLQQHRHQLLGWIATGRMDR
ncbi:MAG TPA: hypothetical protein VGO86_07680 [Candidatus Dormibacteraeota bacterium]